ncbi:MAG TPA: nucleotidyltransferase family protein [Candidatus Binataceae bacterium]|nr:nucleotidyltransferase family protein [Candidatus Binataceae bacterium]
MPTSANADLRDCPDRERALLLLCCGPNQSGEQRARISALLAGELEWPRFQAIAAKNSVVPLVAARLLANGREQLPASIVRQYALVAESTAMRSDYLVASLFEILDTFKRAGIPALTIKGLIIAATAYRNLSLRAFGDLDLVVHRDDLPRAAEALAQIGFRSSCWLSAAFASRFFPDTAIDFSRDRVVLDLHWSLGADYFPFAPRDDEVWRRAIEIDLGGRPVTTMNRDDAILFHAYHAAKHGWLRLQQICDLVYLFALAPPSWEALLADAARTGGRTMLLVGIDLCCSLFAMEVPEPLAPALRAPRVKSLSEKVAQRLFEIREEGEFAEWRAALASIDSRRDRARYLVRRLLSPKLSDCALMPLPRPLYPLYYLARPLLLAVKHPQALRKSGLGAASD